MTAGTRRLAATVAGLVAALACPAAVRPLQVSPPPHLERTLRSDPDPKARIEAAESLATLRSDEASKLLRVALEREREPRVVDALVAVLERLGKPVVDPALCRELTGRSWEAAAASTLFERWRRSVKREEVHRAALEGPPVLRALSLRALTDSPGSTEQESGPGPAGSGEAKLEAPARARLLESVVETLSRQGDLAPSTIQMLHEALWEISGRDMATALRHADRIIPVAARYSASNALFTTDPDGYLGYRRPRQFRLAILLAVGVAVLLASRHLRRFGGVLLVSVLGCAVWSLISRDVRQLPPLPLPPLTSSWIAWLAAGVVAGLIGRLPWETLVRPGLRSFGQFGLSATLAGLLAAMICLGTRAAGWFPLLQVGWDLIVEPFGSLILGMLAGGALAVVDLLIPRRQASRARSPATG